MSQARELAQELHQRPKSDMAQRCITALAHGDRQNPKARAHRKVLMLIRLFPTTRSLMMNASRSRHIKHFPTTAQTITKIEILARRAPRKKRREATDIFERLAPQRTR